jgi:RNA polymerase sigma factor (sigma-70 family)
MDLIEAANEGLMHAARKYKPDEKPRFVSYAVWWIRQYIQKLVDQQARQMSNSMTQVQLNRRVQREQNNALRTLGRQLTIEELVEITKRPRARIEEALSTCIIERSLDEPVDSDEAGSYTLAQMIGDSDRQAEREFERERLQTILRIMRETLDEREFRILVDFFGLNGIREMSFLEIGNTMGITRERVRQLGRRALGKLAKASEHHEELLNYFTPKPGHRLGEFRINSRRKSPLPPEEQEARRQQRAGRRTKEKAT